MNGVREIPIAQLRVSKVNPRRVPGDVRELADSIVQIGIVEPIVVRPDPNADGRFIVLAESRRVAAAIVAGLEKIPAVVREGLSEEQAELLMLAENLQREDLSPLELATVYARLTTLFGLTQAEVAEKVGKSASHVSMYLAFLRQPKKLIQEVEAGEISFSEAMGVGAHRNYSKKPKAKIRGLGVSLHKMDGHEKCNPKRCEVRAFSDQLRSA